MKGKVVSIDEMLIDRRTRRKSKKYRKRQRYTQKKEFIIETVSGRI
jgi:hypothetical protein